MKILLTIAYDGTDFCGWQTQKNGLSVQTTVEDALTRLLGRKTSVLGASRTDAGVHALGQKAAFSSETFAIPTDKLPYALNAHLPQSVAVLKAETVADDFHPIFGAKRKTYEYRFYCAAFRNPLAPKNALFVNHALDAAKMRAAAATFVGTHDFAAFCAAGSSAKTTVRTIYALDIMEKTPEIVLRVTGGGFLYNMVRIIAGTLMYVGEGKFSQEDVLCALSSKNRASAGKTLPPQGLTLTEIVY